MVREERGIEVPHQTSRSWMLLKWSILPSFLCLLLILLVLFLICDYWLLKFVKEEFNSIILHLSKDQGSPASKQTQNASMFRDGWLCVNGVSSHIATWGGWVEDPLPEGESILVFMCGVPGITLFYQDFLEALHKNLQVPVWTICIAGHELPPPSSNLRFPEGSKLYNSVEAQIAHKKAFITNFVPKNKKIYLVGHSFGSKMVIELLKDEKIRHQTEKCILLMPTLERFGETPRAKFWLKCTKNGTIYSIVFLTWVLYYLPHWWRKVFSSLYFQSRGFHHVSESCVEAMIQFCHPTVFYNVRSLVWNELEAITQLDTEVLIDMRDKLKVYFARQDYWAPLTHYETLKSAVPELSIEILDDKFTHAFVLETPEDMAEIIDRDLKPNIITTLDCL